MSYSASAYRANNENNNSSNSNGYRNWYDQCNCCHYGYHIDLDFVRYCESISQEADRTGSIKRRKDRRRQRQSMEVLLGITSPIIPASGLDLYKPIQEQETPKIVQKQTSVADNNVGQLSLIHHHLHHQDGFDDAVSDFERTLQRSKNKLSNNLPDVTAVSEPTLKRAPSNSSMSSTSGSSMTVLPEVSNRDYDTVSIESCGMSPVALQNIREQMALSLERTKQLEDLVKTIPKLQEQLLSLKDENRKLALKVKRDDDNRQNIINTTHYNQNRIKSQSYTNIDSLDCNTRNSKGREPPPPPPRKDFGVNCGVLTRNIGVGHQNPNTKTVSTATSDQLKLLIDDLYKTVGKSTQTPSKEIRAVAIQTAINTHAKTENGTQTLEVRKSFRNASTLVRPANTDFAVQKTVEVNNVGISDDTITDINCNKCNLPKISVAVGPDNTDEAHTGPTISLASLMGSRSKSFNMGEDRLNVTRARTVATQSESMNVTSKSSQYEPRGVTTRACQFELTTHSKATQQDETKVKMVHKNTQSVRDLVSKNTDTKDLIPEVVQVAKAASKSVACEAKEPKTLVHHVGCNTSEKIGCATCSVAVKGEKKEVSPTPSRIPRPHMTPTEVRKFRRQDTYTKIYSPNDSPVSSTLGLSGLDLTPNPVETTGNFVVKHNLNLTEVTGSSTSAQQAHNDLIAPPTRVQIQETTLPVPETALFNPTTTAQPRKKATPTKEMQGAMKVLHDSLHKGQSHGKNLSNLKNSSAITIIQEEWFKISSLVTANPLDVEDYLDAFEDYSSILLQYIVNMIDDSGNTAMHYAVSHGNFDVVSILLDSKVCDINKANKAGYTSVMLVSLAEIRSPTHASVVRRLFELSDVNLKAKQHGQTALMLAVSHGRLDMVKMLIDAGADINIQDEDGSTALMCAAEHGHIEIVKHFLSQPDCDSSITDVDGSTALKIAMEAGHRHIGVLLYAHQRNLHGNLKKKSKPTSPKTPSSPLPIRSSHRALTDTNK